MVGKHKPVLLMRTSLAEEDEMEVARKYLPVYRLRSQIPANSLVIGRYSVLPYYKELEEDLKTNGSQLINSAKQHHWISDLKEWYSDLKDFTFETWFNLHEIPEDGPFVLKGQTNSRKFDWNTHMFAENKRQAIEVYSRLSKDSMISEQDIYIRRYCPLVKLSEGFNGLPISEEYRFFIMDGKVLSGAFYWSSHVDDLTSCHTPARVPQRFLDNIVQRIGDNARFVVVDIGILQNGDPILIELNDGQMSGLSENKVEVLYSNMKKVLNFSDNA